MRSLAAVILGTVAAASVAALPGTAVAAKKKPLPNCAARGSKTLEASSTARVYELKGNRYACGYRKNKRVLLGTDECQNDTQATNFTLKGTYVGWEAISCGLETGDGTIKVTNLNTGKTLYSAPAVTDAAPTGTGERNTYIADYVMRDNGSVAWIGVVNTDGTSTADSTGDVVQVRRLGPGSPPAGELVDTGNDIVLESLALSADGFYYRKGATPKFAPLP